MARVEDLSKSIPVIPNKQMVANIGDNNISFMIMPIYQSDGYSITIYDTMETIHDLGYVLRELEDRLNVYIESYTVVMQ